MEIEVVGVWNGELGWHVFMKGFRVPCVHEHMFLLCISDSKWNGMQVRRLSSWRVAIINGPTPCRGGQRSVDDIVIIVRILRWCSPFTDVLSVCTDIEFNVCGICVRLSTFSESLLGQNK